MSDVETLAAPDPATTHWVPVGPSPPGKDGLGVPQPVVNGQWVKGVGGAAVWSPIADADVPSVNTGGRLGDVGKNITDCNQAIGNGWYFGNAGTPNAPTSDYFSLLVVQLNGPGNLTQTVYAYQTDAVWTRRYKDATAWSPWILRNPGPVLMARVNGDGTLAYGAGGGGITSSRMPAGLGAGDYLVSWVTPIAVPFPFASNMGDIQPIQANPWSQTSCRVTIGLTGSYTSDLPFYLAVFNPANQY